MLAVLLLLLSGAATLTTWLAASYDENSSSARAYQDAPACASAAKAGPDCVLTIPIMVERAWSQTTKGNGKTTTYYVQLVGDAPANGAVQLTRSWDQLTGLAESSALVWRGRLVGLLELNQEYDTLDAPSIVTQLYLNWMIATALCTLFVLTLLLSLFTPLTSSPWRHALTVPSGVGAFSFAVGAVLASQLGDGDDAFLVSYSSASSVPSRRWSCATCMGRVACTDHAESAVALYRSNASAWRTHQGSKVRGLRLSTCRTSSVRKPSVSARIAVIASSRAAARAGGAPFA